jgi:hypothetical protein
MNVTLALALRTHNLACLPDLHVVGTHAGIDGGARRAHGTAELI